MELFGDFRENEDADEMLLVDALVVDTVVRVDSCLGGFLSKIIM